MAVYTPISLGDIYQQANAIKGQQQRQQLGDLQIQEAQKQRADQEGIDSALTSNPNASLADLVKAGGGMAGVEAGTKLNTARASDLLQQNRQIYVAASQVASAEDPIAAAKQVAPNFIADFEKTHGPGSFSQLAPDQVKQLAAGLQQHALMGLVDPDKQFQAQQALILENQKQLGPGGELKRKQMEIDAANVRAAAERAQQARGQNITMRGQDLEAARAGIPAGYERDPNNPGALRPIVGGPHDPNATSAGMDSRSSVMFNRVAASANEAVTALKNIAELPVTTSTGWFGGAQPATTLMGSVKSVLGQKITSQEAQDYKTMIAGVSRSLSTIETAGLAPNGSITHSMDSITLNEGDSQLTKLRKLAETRQIIEKGIEPNLSNPKLAPAQRQLIERIVSDVQQAIPFTQHDITKLQQSKNPNATLMDFAKQTGLPTAQATSSGAIGVRQDLADLQAQPGSAGTNSAQWDKRVDGSDKGNGWLGVLRRPDGGVSSEISVGVNIGGKETEIPLMVPSLTKSEVTTLLSSDPKDPNFFSKLPPSIKQKAVSFARDRIAQGQSPFASPNESPGARGQGGSHPPAIQSLLDKYK